MGALMDECSHGSDGSYSDPSVEGCPYCEIDRLIEIIRARGQHADACDFYGECHCELKEFELGS